MQRKYKMKLVHCTNAIVAARRHRRKHPITVMKLCCGNVVVQALIHEAIHEVGCMVHCGRTRKCIAYFNDVSCAQVD